MICPLPSRIPDCPRAPCADCLVGLEERSGILQFGQGTPGRSEVPTCATREAAEALASQQARDQIKRRLRERAERKARERLPPQMRLAV